MSECTCATLAQTENGHVRLCRAGCLHLTFGRVTLHFESLDDFGGLAEVVAEEERLRKPTEGMTLTYQWFALDLRPEDCQAFAALVAAALEAGKWARGDVNYDEILQRAREEAPGC